MRILLLLSTLFFALNQCLAQVGAPDPSSLPDVLRAQDGSIVTTPSQWELRRAELKALFEDEVYGHLPPIPDRYEILVREHLADADLGSSIKTFDLKLVHGTREITLDASLIWPTDSESSPPVVIQCRWRGFGPEAQKAGPVQDMERVQMYIKAGYAVLEFDYQSLAPDNKETFKSGSIYQLFGQDIDTGALMAWAWGMHRMVDAAEFFDEVNAKQTIVTGHSRLGKAALVAGAFDERIALTLPNHSGCSGAAPYRLIYGNNERLQNIAGYAPQWFRPGFENYADKVETLPVDQHMLMALVAPRALLNGEGTEDNWTNPQGVQQTYLASRKVFQLLRAEHMQSIRYRQVGHIPNPVDLIEFGNHLFFGAELPEDFGQLPY